MKKTELFSYFKPGVQNTIPLLETSLIPVYTLIRSFRLKEVTEKVRLGLASKLKDLPAVCFSGTFKSRGIAGLLHYSGLICLDVDMLEDAPSLKERLSKDAFLNPVLLFISPRGHGLKIIVRVKNGGADCHEQYFEALVHYMKGTHGIKIDQSGSDISRLCFLCWDPEPYWFEDGFVTAEDLLKLLPKTQQSGKGDAINRVSTSPSACFVNALQERRDAIHRVSYDGISESARDAMNRVSTGPDAPSDRLNHTPAVHELAVSVLKKHGWRPKDDKSDLWVRAGKKIREGHSAKYSFYPPEGIHFLYNFSSNAQPFLQNKAYTDVQVICEMDYAGDFKKCISELSRRYSEPRDTM